MTGVITKDRIGRLNLYINGKSTKIDECKTCNGEGWSEIIY